MKRKIISITQLNSYVARLMEEDYMLSDLWVSGEISNCKYHHSGHIYFTIKDEAASIQAVMFMRDASKIAFRLADGIKVYARVRVSLYEKTGSYQAYVQDIEKQGKGLLYERFEQLKAKLLAEGLFDAQYKKKLPAFPERVGVITSATGAVVKDIIKVARRRNAGIPLYIYPVHVQGEFAVKEITEAIGKANKDKLVDVLILGRGGGTIEDLWAFNEETVARAVFESKIPIVSAIGHETDFTIADFVSDQRAATPSAAAEIVIPDRKELEETIRRYRSTLIYIAEQNIRQAKDRLEYLTSRPVFRIKDKLYKDKMQQTDLLMQALNSAYKRILTNVFNRYEITVSKLHKLSPVATLSRGYSFVTNSSQNVVKSISDIKKDEVLDITVTDGRVKVQVLDKESKYGQKGSEEF